MKKILSLLSIFAILFSSSYNGVIAASKYIGTVSKTSKILNNEAGISSETLKKLINIDGVTSFGRDYILEVKGVSEAEIKRAPKKEKVKLAEKILKGGLTSLQVTYLKNNYGFTSKGLILIGSDTVKNSEFSQKRTSLGNGVYQVNFKTITADNAGKTLETWTGKDNFPTKVLLKNGMSLDLDKVDLDKQFVKTDSLKSRAANLKRQNIDFGKMDLKEPEIRLLPDRLQIVQKTTIEFKTQAQLKNIKEKLDFDGKITGAGNESNDLQTMFSDLDNNLPTGATKTLNNLAGTDSLRGDALPDNIDSEILDGLILECKKVKGNNAPECAKERLTQEIELATKTLEGEEIISFSLIPPTAAQVKSGDLNIKKDPTEVRMSMEEIDENFDEYGLINQEIIESTDSESDDSLYSQTNPFDDPSFCANQHGTGSTEYNDCKTLMENRNNPKEKEYDKTLLNGFTVGKADSYEWKKTLKIDLWVKTIKIFEVRFGFYYSYGFGLRIPIKAKVKVSKDVADNWNDENSQYDFEVSAETFNAEPADYSSMGISDTQIFNGKEFVFEFKAGFTYKIRAFRNTVDLNGNISLFDILIAVLGKDEIMNSLGLSEEEYNKLVTEKGIDKSLDFVPPFDGANRVSLAKFGIPIPIIDWAYFRMLGFIGTEVLLDGGITADCRMINSNGGCNGKSEIKKTPRSYNANANFNEDSKDSDELGFYSNYGPSFDNFRYYPELIFRIFAKAGASVKIPLYGWKTVRSPEITIYEMTISSDNLYLGTHDGTDGKLDATEQKIYSTNPNIVLNTPQIKITTSNNASKLILENTINPGTWYVYTLDGAMPNCITSNRYNGPIYIWPESYKDLVISKKFNINIQGCSAYGDETDILKNTINLENEAYNLSVYADSKLNGYFKFMPTSFPGNKIAYTFDGTKAKCENSSEISYIGIENLHLTDTLSPTYSVPINAISCNEDNGFIESKRFNRVYTIENTLYNPVPKFVIDIKEVSTSYYPISGYKTYIKYKLSPNKITTVSSNDYISCEGDWGDKLLLIDNGETNSNEISGLVDYSNTYVSTWTNEENQRFGGKVHSVSPAKSLFAKTCIRDNSGNLVFESDVKIANIPEMRDGSEILDLSNVGVHDAFLDSLKNGGLDGFLDRDGMMDFLETHGGLTAGGTRDLFSLMGKGGISMGGLKSISNLLNPINGFSANQQSLLLNNSRNSGLLSVQGVQKVGKLLGSGKLKPTSLIALNNLAQNPNSFDGYSPSPMNAPNMPANNLGLVTPGGLQAQPAAGLKGSFTPGGLQVQPVANLRDQLTIGEGLLKKDDRLESDDEYVNEKLKEINDCFKEKYLSHLENIEKTIKVFKDNRDKAKDEKTKEKYQKAIDKLEEIKSIFIEKYKNILKYEEGDFSKVESKTVLSEEAMKIQRELTKEKQRQEGMKSISALNLADVFSKLGESTQNTEDDITKHSNTMDSANTKDIQKLSLMMQKWTIATQLQSNALKIVAEGIKSTVANIR